MIIGTFNIHRGASPRPRSSKSETGPKWPRGIEPEGGYLAERREVQRVEHPARLKPGSQ